MVDLTTQGLVDILDYTGIEYFIGEGEVQSIDIAILVAIFKSRESPRPWASAASLF
jgi:hypothetical protein